MDINWIKEHLRKTAYSKSTPAELPKRQAVVMLMDKIIQLREEGFSFNQIALATSDLGLEIRGSTLEMIYKEEIMRLADDQISQLAALSQQLKLKSGMPEASKPAPTEQTASISKENNKHNTTQGEVGEFGLINTKKHASGEVSQFTDFGSATETSPDTPTIAISSKKSCMPLRHDVAPIPVRAGLPSEVYEEQAILEHPAINGLMLTKEQRLYHDLLEYADEHCVIQMETPHQRVFRIKWKKPIPPRISSTDSHFINLDPALFPKG